MNEHPEPDEVAFNESIPSMEPPLLHRVLSGVALAMIAIGLIGSLVALVYYDTQGEIAGGSGATTRGILPSSGEDGSPP